MLATSDLPNLSVSVKLKPINKTKTKVVNRYLYTTKTTSKPWAHLSFPFVSLANGKIYYMKFHIAAIMACNWYSQIQFSPEHAPKGVFLINSAHDRSYIYSPHTTNKKLTIKLCKGFLYLEAS